MIPKPKPAVVEYGELQPIDPIICDQPTPNLDEFRQWCEDFEYKFNELSVRVRALEQQWGDVKSSFDRAILQARKRGYTLGYGDAQVDGKRP